MDFDQLANAMFPNQASSTPDRAPAMPTDSRETELAERLFGESTKRTPPSAPNLHDKRPFNSLDEADQAERLFGGGDPALYFGDAMREIESSAMQDFLQTPEEAKEASAFWGDQFQSFGLTSTESKALTDIGVSAFNNPPTPQLVETWVEQSRSALVQDWGPQGAAQALADARDLISAYATPEVRDMLMATGLGNHPALVRLAAAKARAMRVKGRF